MSSRRSEARKILRAAARQEKKQEKERKRRLSLVEKHRKPGESDEDMTERMKRDLGGWLEMMTEREVEDMLTAKAAELKTTEDAEVLTETQEENPDG